MASEDDGASDERDKAPTDDDREDGFVAATYEELRRLARARMANQPPGQTLQATALVHEALLRLDAKLDGKLEAEPSCSDRNRYLYFAATRAMRDILVERARSKGRLRHGGGRARVDLDSLEIAAAAPPESILALESALAELDAEKRELVELRFYGGFTMAEIADMLGKPLRSLERQWRFTRAKLFSMLAAD